MRSMMDSCLKLSAQDLRLYLFDEAQQPPRLFFVTTSFDSVVEIGYSNILFGYFDCLFTGKSFSEALILESVNPQYDDRLIIHS